MRTLLRSAAPTGAETPAGRHKRAVGQQPAVHISIEENKRSHYSYGSVFITGVLLYLIAVLPFLIYHGGIFFYYGDYNVQQVPFYVLANRAVHEGNFFWNSRVDLGSSMGGSFAFYLWGSPFFWLSTLFPEKVVPYVLPFLMSLKYGTALTCAYAWTRTLAHTDRGALLAALLYAFSGLQAVNIVFQHMHDATAFFPLYLLAFDRFLRSCRRTDSAAPVSFVRDRLPFVLMTALSAVVNYYFFYGQVIFIVLYYFVRYVAGSHLSFRNIVREILLLLVHGLLGLLLDSFFLIQVWDILQGNSRLNDVIAGYDMVAYHEPTTPLAILKSMFFIPDNIGRGTLFTSDQVKNSSLSAYLPGFAMAGVIGYFHAHWSGRGKSRPWLCRFALVFAVIAFVPVLNAVFSAFNNEYYARWFYMPILFLAVMTARELEDCDQEGLRLGLLVNWTAYVLCIVISFLPSRNDDGVITAFSLLQYPDLFTLQAIVSGVCLAIASALICWPAGLSSGSAPASDSGTDSAAAPTCPLSSRISTIEEEEASSPAGSSAGRTGSFLLWIPRPFSATQYGLLTRKALCLTMVVCLLSTMGVMFNGTSIIARSGGVKWQQQMLDNKPALPDTDGWFRVETDGTSTNYEMVWGYPTIHCFESTVTPSIVDFYAGIGVSRTVDSKMNFSHVGARYILSQRYYLDNAIIHQDQDYEDKGGLTGFAAAGESDGYHIYRNLHFIPMGFTFDSYMTEENYAMVDSDRQQDRLLVRNLILDEDAAAKYGTLLQETSVDEADNRLLTEDDLLSDADQRAATACNSFSFDKDGFQATTSNLPKENLVFFSVPFDRGWTATVDGQKAEIVRADFGLMAVDVPAGVHEIRFSYLPYGLLPAVGVSIAAAVLILLLVIRDLAKRK